MRRADLRGWLASTKLGWTARLVFAVLGLYDRDLEAWPSVATIVEVSGLSRRAVQYALRDLEAAGDVVADRRPGKSTRYQLYPQGGAPLAPQGVHDVHLGGAPDDQNLRTSCTQKELKELKKENGAAVPLSTRDNGGTVRGALTRGDGATFLPGTGWIT